MLSGCATGEGGSATQANAFAFSDVVVGAANFETLTNDAVAAPATFATDLPSGGSANYDGLMAVIIDDGSIDGVLGTIRLNVNFDNNGFSGAADSFRNFDNDATPGSLNISGGTIAAAGPAGGVANVNGTINFLAGPMSINETYTHVFSGVDGEYNIGALDGTAQPSIGGPIDIISSWSVERQ